MTILIHPAFEYDDDSSWFRLSSWLEFWAHNWVYGSHSLRWQGEEEEIIEDIVSESIINVFPALPCSDSISTAKRRRGY